ncbi:MAG: redox-regulated ATPase YchF [Candidatus Pacebacteria bacterium]|nr:redox-regulated ATPase YchF [Candidatus Paceibacterota bacterium]
MSLSIGIVGLPNVGKSTLFNALTENGVEMANYPFCTIDPSVGIVVVPDERIDMLADLSHSAKRIPAVVEFVDIAGLVKGASAGEGLGNQFLTNIRETDAIAQVVRIFEDEDVIHVDGEIDPLRDIQIINMELILTDLQTLEKRLNNIERDVKKQVKEAVFEKETLLKIQKALEDEKLALSVELTEKEMPIVKNMHLLTRKPMLFVLNKKAGARNLNETHDTRFDELMNYLNTNKLNYVVVDAGIEQELSGLDTEEKNIFRLELDSEEGADGIAELIREAYKMLGLMTYFTTGEDETRGWTIKINSTAPEAGAAIHTDFRDGFIRAEVVCCDDLLSSGSYAVAREKGLIRTEGKEYIVKNGDVIEFKV